MISPLNNSFCFFFYFYFDLVLAISCYQCTPQPPDTMCTSGNINITDCDNLGAAKGLYDACGKVNVEMSMGEQTLTMNAMACMMKVI